MNISRYVVLNIKSARLYRGADGKYKNPRNVNNTMWVEPITKYQVYNVLATLCGERTVSSISRRMKTKEMGGNYAKENENKPHFTYDFSDNQYFLDWADMCLLNTNRTNNLVVCESIRINKSQTTSKVMFNTLVTWEDFIWYFVTKNDNDVSDLTKFKKFMLDEFNIDMERGVFTDDLFKIYSTPKFIEFNKMVSKYIKQKTFLSALVGYVHKQELILDKKAVLTYQDEDTKKRYFTKFGLKTDVVLGSFGDIKVFDPESRFSRINTKGFMGKTENIYGQLLVPIRIQDGEDGLDYRELMDYKMLSKGPGVSTILDGGCVVIDRIIMPYHIDDLPKYELVGDISLEESNYVKN